MKLKNWIQWYFEELGISLENKNTKDIIEDTLIKIKNTSSFTVDILPDVISDDGFYIKILKPDGKWLLIPLRDYVWKRIFERKIGELAGNVYFLNYLVKRAKEMKRENNEKKILKMVNIEEEFWHKHLVMEQEKIDGFEFEDFYDLYRGLNSFTERFDNSASERNIDKFKNYLAIQHPKRKLIANFKRFFSKGEKRTNTEAGKVFWVSTLTIWMVFNISLWMGIFPFFRNAIVLIFPHPINRSSYNIFKYPSLLMDK